MPHIGNIPSCVQSVCLQQTYRSECFLRHSLTASSIAGSKTQNNTLAVTAGTLFWLKKKQFENRFKNVLKLRSLRFSRVSELPKRQETLFWIDIVLAHVRKNSRVPVARVRIQFLFIFCCEGCVAQQQISLRRVPWSLKHRLVDHTDS